MGTFFEIQCIQQKGEKTTYPELSDAPLSPAEISNTRVIYTN